MTTTTSETLDISSSTTRPVRASDRTRTVPRFPLRTLGLGTAVPSTRISNHDLARRLDTNDAWIVGRTGIRARRVAGPDDSTTSLAVAAAGRALADARTVASAIDLVIVATATPDTPCPSTAARVIAALGLRAGGFDVNAACSGFVHAFHTAAALLGDPAIATVLVIGVDRFTTLTDPDDRSTAILFGDGAGAAVLSATDPVPGAPGILSSDIGGDATGLASLSVEPDAAYLTMDGPDLFRRATRGMVASASTALSRAGADARDVDLFVPHQANARIIGAAADRLGIPSDRVVYDLGERANTVAASVPLALGSAQAAGRLHAGDEVLISAIGAGLSWASLHLRWGR